MSILDVEQLSHSYGDKAVLQNISFRILKGEHIGLVGANGAGKSTLFNLLTGKLLPDSGHIHWNPTAKLGNLEQHIQLESGVTMMAFLQGAFQDLLNAEQEMLAISMEMGNASGEQLDKLLQRYSHLQTILDQHDFYQMDAKIEEVAAGLGLTSLGLKTDVSKLSGGQRTKLLLAKLLLTQPEVLLLDEPTNYLDLAHIEWLKNYLSTYPHAFVLISHDTGFMNEVVNVIYHLEHKQLFRYTGNYQQFLKAYELRKEQIYQQYQKQQEEIQKLETYIQKNKARASTAKQAKSREKKLEKMVRIDKPTDQPKSTFSFQVHYQPARLILETEELKIGYHESLFSAMNIKLERGEKVAIVGHNGIGKTTTLKTLLGQIKPIEGKVILGDRVQPVYFSQEVLIKGNQTALEEICSLFPHLTQKEARTMLARCGLRSEHIFQPLRTLSGGEQTKVRLCQLQLTTGNVLVLDEPTNHLDTSAKEALQQALQAYEGTILLVSHEPEFYQSWVTQVWDMEKWV